LVRAKAQIRRLKPALLKPQSIKDLVRPTYKKLGLSGRARRELRYEEFHHSALI
jgi:hypothetical protein